MTDKPIRGFIDAKVIQIDEAGHSYGIFCYTSIGDLFLNSDWGFFGYAWRSYGENFEQFLSQLEPDYVLGKFEINLERKGGLKKHEREHLTALFLSFRDEIKQLISASLLTNGE